MVVTRKASSLTLVADRLGVATIFLVGTVIVVMIRHVRAHSVQGDANNVRVDAPQVRQDAG